MCAGCKDSAWHITDASIHFLGLLELTQLTGGKVPGQKNVKAGKDPSD